MNFDFTITKTSSKSKARLGTLSTPHGTFLTPAFIFCATKAAIKVATPTDIKNLKTQIILANTYHLMLRPGADVIANAGGLHAFMGWNGPMLTDSGGFQIFSLGHGGIANEIKGNQLQSRRKMLQKITEEGAIFRSYIDGSIHTLTPESSVHIQQKLGADIILPLDICTPFHINKQETYEAMQRSHRWELRSLETHLKNPVGSAGTQSMYGIIQGGIYPEFREESIKFVNEHPFFGQAIGGSLGQSKNDMQYVVQNVMKYANPSRPTHLLGIGSVSHIIHGVQQGVDTFDCVLPTRLARHGWALMMDTPYKDYKMNLKNSTYKYDNTPIDPLCDCTVCTHPYTRSYLHHLIQVKEMLGAVLLTLHNIRFMNRLFENIREDIQHHTL